MNPDVKICGQYCRDQTQDYYQQVIIESQGELGENSVWKVVTNAVKDES